MPHSQHHRQAFEALIFAQPHPASWKRCIQKDDHSSIASRHSGCLEAGCSSTSTTPSPKRTRLLKSELQVSYSEATTDLGWTKWPSECIQPQAVTSPIGVILSNVLVISRASCTDPRQHQREKIIALFFDPFQSMHYKTSGHRFKSTSIVPVSSPIPRTSESQRSAMARICPQVQRIHPEVRRTTRRWQCTKAGSRSRRAQISRRTSKRAITTSGALLRSPPFTTLSKATIATVPSANKRRAAGSSDRILVAAAGAFQMVHYSKHAALQHRRH